VLLAAALAGGARSEDAAPNAKLGKQIDNFTLAGADGKAFALHDVKEKKAVVIVFLSFECPVSTSYSQPLADLARNYADKGVAFVGICATADEDAAQVAKHGRDYKIPFPVYRDDKLTAVDALKAETTPEAFVLDHNFVLRYRGRIDNGWAARLKKNQQITRHDLRQALDELLAGKPVGEPVTQAVGCPVRQEKVVRQTGAVTYHRDVLPILQNRCQGCHRPGEVGPFSLMTYRQAVNWASDIKDYTQARKMPPWKPTEGPVFLNERKLNDQEMATLAAWVDGGTPEGDPKDAPPPRQFTEGWQLGQPDLVLTPEDDFELGPSGRDAFRVFVIPTNLDEDKYVTAVEVRPGNRRVAHHALIFLDRTGKGRELTQQEKDRPKKENDQDRGAGYSVAMGVGFLPQGGLGGWAPGQMARHLPEGTGYYLPKGSDVVVQMHYHRNGRAERDRTTIGLYFAKRPVAKRFQGTVIPGRFLFIPANEERYKVTGTLPVNQDLVLYSVMPHMHMLGKEVKVTIRPPDGPPQTLVAIKDWDYNWQETYFLKEPMALKAGTRFEVEAYYDNSAKNPNNPFNPPRAVRFGEQTDNEMCFVFLGATSDKPLRSRGTAPPAEEKKPDEVKKP
jgi:peroxiredoxin